MRTSKYITYTLRLRRLWNTRDRAGNEWKLCVYALYTHGIFIVNYIRRVPDCSNTHNIL